MNDALSQAFSRLTVHEFMLEIMMANWLASMPQEEAKQFISQLRQGSRKLWSAGQPTMDDAEIDRWMADIHTLQNHFLDKVSRRVDEIRGITSRG